jgi:flavin-dependent dehydrogenase
MATLAPGATMDAIIGQTVFLPTASITTSTISPSVAAARAGARVLLVEAEEEVGGTGVHSPVALVCTFRDHDDRPINAGLHREYFPMLYDNPSPRDRNPAQEWFGPRLECYDHRELLKSYQRLIAAESNLTVWTSCRVSAVRQKDGEIEAVRLEGAQAGCVRANCSWCGILGEFGWGRLGVNGS